VPLTRAISAPTALLIVGLALLGWAGSASAAPTTVLNTPRAESWQSDVAMNSAGANVVAYVSQSTIRYGAYVRART